MVDEKIFWGFDIGTDSVGWAVTNSEYKLKKYKNNLMWGVHLFDEAKQSAERRSFRTARRRLDRRKQRIILLQESFVRAVCEKDENFFRRLKESALLPEDAEQITFSLTILITLIRIILKSTQLYITLSVSLWKAKNLMM